MTATLHISRRSPHHPRATLRELWTTFQLRHSRRARTAYFEAARTRYPLSDEQDYRHALETPALEDAFIRLAVDHADRVTPADGGTSARDTDREQLLLATCDAWFREVHGPEHRWDARTVATYDRLLADIQSCFHPGGTS